MGMLLYYPVPILLSFVVPSVITMFKKNIHSLFNLNLNLNLNPTTTTTTQSDSVVSGLALVTATPDNNLPNVLESATLNSKPSITENCPDQPSIGFVAGDVDGLMSCTESLGFESSDEWRVNDDRMVNSDDENDEIWRKKMMMKKAESRGNLKRSFPPPLPSLNRNGKPSFYLRPVRKNGRLELTEVRIHRPDILHAKRHDGRLTLHLIPDSDEEEDEEEEEQEQEHVEEEEEEENRGIPMLRRCHEMVNQQHLHGNHHMRMCGISIV